MMWIFFFFVACLVMWIMTWDTPHYNRGDLDYDPYYLDQKRAKAVFYDEGL